MSDMESTEVGKPEVGRNQLIEQLLEMEKTNALLPEVAADLLAVEKASAREVELERALRDGSSHPESDPRWLEIRQARLTAAIGATYQAEDRQAMREATDHEYNELSRKVSRMLLDFRLGKPTVVLLAGYLMRSGVRRKAEASRETIEA